MRSLYTSLIELCVLTSGHDETWAIINPPSRCADATKIILILTLRRRLHSNRQDRSILVGLTSLYIVGLCNVLSSNRYRS
jgi:hypothetical protein